MADITATIRLKDEASSQFSKIGQAAQQAANKMTNVGKAIDQAFSGNRAGQFASSMSTSVGEAASTLGSFRTSIGEAAREAQSFGSSVSASISSAGSGLSGFGSSVSESMNDAKSSMDDMADSAKEVGDAVQDAGEGASGFSEIGNKASEAGEQVNSLTQKTNTLHETFSKLVQLVGGAMIAKKIKDYGEESVQAFSDYESGIAEVSTLLPDASKAEMDQLGEGAKQIALDTGAEINDVTSAMYQAISASVPQDQVLDFLRTAEKAATGGVTDMETAVDAITSVTNAYGTDTISATEASDKMFSAVKLGKTTFDELAGSLYNVVPTAVGAGVSFDDITGALAAMTAQGVPTSVATTQLRQAIVELSDSGSNTGKKFKELAGTGFRDFIAQGNNLSDAFQIMQQEADKTGVGVNELFSSVEAGNAVLSLSGDHAQLFADDIAAMQDSSGATDTAYGKMTDTVAHRSELMKAQFEDIKLSAGEALEEGLGGAVSAIGDNIDSIKEPVVEFFHGIGDAIGNLAPMLPGLLKGITSFATNVIKLINPILDFFSKNPDLMGTVLGGIGAGLATWKLGSMDWSQMGIVKAITALSSNPVAAGLTATAAGVTAVTIAVEKYKQAQVDANVQQHFGTLKLSQDEISEMVGQVIDIPYTANMQEVSVQFENAEQAKADAESALSEMHSLDWKVSSLHLDLTETEGQQLIDNATEFVSAVKEYMTSNEEGAEGTVTGLLGETASSAIVTEMADWFSTDQANVEQLSSSLTNLITTAVNDGTYNVDVAAAAQILVAKIMEMSGMAQDAALEAKFETLGLQYSGAALDPDTWAQFVESGKEYMQEQKSKELDDLTTTLTELNIAAQNDPTRQSEVDRIKKVLEQAYTDQNANGLATFMSNNVGSINEGYKNELANAQMNMDLQAGKYLPDLQSAFASYGNGNITEEEMTARLTGTNQAISSYQTVGIDQTTQAALSDRYSYLVPSVEDMQGVIDQAIEKGQAVPKAFMDAYNQTMRLGAESGDQDATWGYMASQLVSSGGYDDFMKTVEESGYQIPEGFKKALERANVDTRDSISDEMVKGIGEAVQGVQGPDWDNVKKILHDKGYDLLDSEGEDFNTMAADEIASQYLQFQGMTTTGETTTIEGGTVGVKYNLDPGQTVWSIAGKVAGEGADEATVGNIAQQILEANGITNEGAQNLDVGTQIVVPEKLVLAPTVDSSNVGQAVADASSSAAGSASSTQTVSTTTQNNVTTETTVTNTGDAAQETHDQTQAALDTPIDITGKTNVTVSQTNNAAEVYDQVASDLRSAFSSAISISANATVNMNWSISNASKTITLDGASGGSFTITAHKFGGYFTEPHIGMVAEAGPEWIIPDNGSAESAEMLMEAASSILGSGSGSDKVAPDMAAYLGSGNGSGGTSSSKDINININGNGTIRASGMSREQVVEILQDNLRPVLLNIVSTEDAEEGMLAYEY